MGMQIEGMHEAAAVIRGSIVVDLLVPSAPGGA